MTINLKLSKLIKGGLFSVFGASVINKGILFVSNIIIVRLMFKNEYGNFSYAQNALNLFMLISGLGTTAAIMQFRSENRDFDDKKYYTSIGIAIGIISNIFLSLIIFLVGYNNLLILKNSNTYLIYLFLVPIFLLIIDYIFVILRSEYKNNKFAILTIINTILTFGTTFLGLYFYNAYIMIIFRYIAYIITIIIGIYMIKDYLTLDFKVNRNRYKFKEFIKFSMVTALSNVISQFILYIDAFIIGMLIIDPNITANYKIATTIPLNLTFIPTSIITFIYPYFAKNKDSLKWIKNKTYKLIISLLFINLILCGVLIIFAPTVIKLLFGREYLDAVYIFRILILGFLIQSTFRIPFGNILVMVRKINYNLINSVLSGIINIILNIILIYRYNDVGAAYAKLFTFLISSIIGFIFFKRYLNNSKNKCMKEEVA